MHTGPPSSSKQTAIADTGSTATFASPTTPVLNKRITDNPITVRNPNGALMYSTHKAELNFPQLPKIARHVHILPELKSDPLISIGQLCDAGCTISFDATTVNVTHDDETVLT